MWGATACFVCPYAVRRDFNPRSPCGERLQRHALFDSGRGISIHAPRVGSDPRPRRRAARIFYFNPRSPCGERRADQSVLPYPRVFQSTLPVWGATARSIGRALAAAISIHAPRVGSDAVHRCIRCQHDISIHAPRVGSDSSSVNVIPPFLLISIHAPRVGSDRSDVLGVVLEDISIHAPRVGSDRSHGNLAGIMSAFQSTLPVWGATAKAART